MPSAMLRPASGGIISINGVRGAIINDSATADRGKPGRDIIINPINQIDAATGISMPINGCDPQSQLQRVQQQIQQRVQQILEQKITQIIQQDVAQNANVQNLQQQLQNIQQQINQSVGQTNQQDLQQQQEIVNQELQNQVKGIIAGAIGKASQQLPNAAKVANSAAAGLKPVAAVAESLSTFVPSQGINMGNYGSKIKTVQTVSQACFI